MQENHNPVYTAWITAETEAYTAVHRLHQFTCGARKAIPLAAMEKIMALRKAADARFAALQNELGIADAVAPIAAARERVELKSGVRVSGPQLEDRALQFEQSRPGF